MSQVDDGTRALMPRLADIHVHLSFASIPQAQLLTGLPSNSTSAVEIPKRPDQL